MIEVQHLVKRYGTHEAVSDLSFTIEKGRIYGFLGPNGAGKSTTMNIITGCLAATSGTVQIDGYDIFEEPEKAKRMIGYLPEIPPLYGDMTPNEYLMTVAALKKIPRAGRKAEVQRVSEKTDIVDMGDRLIKNLSKGYRQRVGIAQALLGSPEVIILDEPTVGLDPAQIIEIRSLIRELGSEHTVILSSHILTEVSQICDDILIISGGRLVASGTPEELSARFAGDEVLYCTLASEDAAVWLSEIEGVQSVEGTTEGGDTTYAIVAESGADVRESVFYACAEHKSPILELYRERGSLEDIFMELTAGRPEEEAPEAEDAPETESEEEAQ